MLCGESEYRRCAKKVFNFMRSRVKSIGEMTGKRRCVQTPAMDQLVSAAPVKLLSC